MYTSDAVKVAPNSRLEGSEAIRAYFDEMGKAVSDINIETSVVIEDGDTVVAEWTYRTTQTGPATQPDGADLAVTGKTLEVAGVTFCKVRKGKFATTREYFDTADLARQLGLTPST